MAEDLAHLYARREGLPVVVLRAARFFPEADDDPERRAAYSDDNLKANEFTYRRLDIEDCAEAHLLTVGRAPGLGFARLILSAPTPFLPGDAAALGTDAEAALFARVPEARAIYARLGWRMLPRLDRVY
ncbi:hypothetical protein, partial [Rhodosalinus halophilus]